MNSKHAKTWALPFIFIGALAVSACSSDPMMMDAAMTQEDQGMDAEMMDEMQDGDGMEQGMDPGKENPMDGRM